MEDNDKGLDAFNGSQLTGKKFILPRFNTVYVLAQSYIKEGDLLKAKEKYIQLKTYISIQLEH